MEVHLCFFLSVTMVLFYIHSYILLAVDCGPLSDPPNGVVSVSGTTFGETATYHCQMGYMLSNDSSRLCQFDGVWSETAPNCNSQCNFISTVCVVRM